ncbi:class I SAM-dependent methyltransferase [uncultured Thiodictyon sp.]|jgi:SAM-dependent methyltransferase|uniref:class I SAM-dependent methyltransferase n=1 Tax=uncultured Thiodictyon sp. TaxID=1846217 RepID=UPI0025F4A7DA|nr:class I SAM-dependent methyltransferase [uncultured Thiodictyon sp.]
MQNRDTTIDLSYEQFYAQRAGTKVYPTEFVVRTFLANYPGLRFLKPAPGDRILDIGFGDGRNTAFLCEQGLDVSGIELTQGIVDQTAARLARLGHVADLRIGRNSQIPFASEYFRCILACHCCYYCDEGEFFTENLAEYARVLQPGGYLVASVASRNSYIFKDAIELPDGTLRITTDPYGNRNGYRLQAFNETQEIANCFSPFFADFSFGFADNDYYGIFERIYWVVCRRI